MKTTRITIETETSTIIRGAKTAIGWCPNCRAEVDVITLDHDNPAEPATAEFQQWLAAGKLHLWQATHGPVLLCVPSLFRCFEWEEPARFHSPTENSSDSSRKKE